MVSGGVADVSDHKNRSFLSVMANLSTIPVPSERGGPYQQVGIVGDMAGQFRVPESEYLRVYSKEAILKDCEGIQTIGNHTW